MLKSCTAIMLVYWSVLLAWPAFGAGAASIYPIFSIDPTGSYAKVKIANTYNDAVLCSSIKATAEFAAASGAVGEMIHLENTLVWGKQKLELTAGKDLVDSVREDAPDAKLRETGVPFATCNLIGLEDLANLTANPLKQIIGSRDSGFQVAIAANGAGLSLQASLNRLLDLSQAIWSITIKNDGIILYRAADATGAPHNISLGTAEAAALLRKASAAVLSTDANGSNADVRALLVEVLGYLAAAQNQQPAANATPPQNAPRIIDRATYQIRNKYAGKCLNALSWSTMTGGKNEGDPIGQWACSTTVSEWSNNFWQVVKDWNASTYSLRSLWSNTKCLAPKNDGSAAQYTCDHTGNISTRSFYIELQPSGDRYRLRHAQTNLCLSSGQDRTINDGDSLHFDTCDGARADQSFDLLQMTVLDVGHGHFTDYITSKSFPFCDNSARAVQDGWGWLPAQGQSCITSEEAWKRGGWLN